MTDEVRLEGGSMTHVVRVGDTVRRSPGRQSAAVQALLRHLESQGVDGAPRALGFDGVTRDASLAGDEASRVSLVVGWRINASLLGFAQRSNTDMRSVKSKEDKPVSDQYTLTYMVS